MISAELEELRRHAHESPADIPRAMAYWHALEDVAGDNLKSPARLLDALRTVACSSAQGAYVFAQAYEELQTLTGVAPELDEPLRMSLIGAVGLLPPEASVVVERLITPRTMWQRD